MLIIPHLHTFLEDRIKKYSNFATINVLAVRLFCILFSFSLFLNVRTMNAQVAGTQLIRDLQYAQTPGKVSIVQDNNIVKLIDKHLYEESKRKGITGYRVRIYSNSGKQAYIDGPKVQAEFINKYEAIKTHYVFDSPFWSLYVGDFRTHSNAMKFLKSIEAHYPDAFIVRTRINYPAL
jgi:hypothetical protein